MTSQAFHFVQGLSEKKRKLQLSAFFELRIIRAGRFTKITILFSVRVRDHFVSLVGLSYTSISMKDFSGYVGLPEKEAYALALQQPGWKFDEPSK